MPETKTPSYSQRHPYLFGFAVIIAAVALVTGAMAALASLARFGSFERTFAEAQIGVVRVEGEILFSEPYTDWIDELAEDERVKGVIVRIDSPGGLVAPSQEIYGALLKLAEKKPVVASMGSVAASGGYYVAAAAGTIIANPGTLTGSIGVKAELPNLEKLLDKIGVSFNEIASGRLKNAGSPYRAMTPEERDYFQAMVMDIHRQFVADVASAREMPVEKVEALADGRALTGNQALDAGLVDELGGFAQAVELVKDECGLTGRVPLKDGPPAAEESLVRRVLSELGLIPDGSLPGRHWVMKAE